MPRPVHLVVVLVAVAMSARRSASAQGDPPERVAAGRAGPPPASVFDPASAQAPLLHSAAVLDLWSNGWFALCSIANVVHSVGNILFALHKLRLWIASRHALRDKTSFIVWGVVPPLLVGCVYRTVPSACLGFHRRLTAPLAWFLLRTNCFFCTVASAFLTVALWEAARGRQAPCRPIRTGVVVGAWTLALADNVLALLHGWWPAQYGGAFAKASIFAQCLITLPIGVAFLVLAHGLIRRLLDDAIVGMLTPSEVAARRRFARRIRWAGGSLLFSIGVALVYVSARSPIVTWWAVVVGVFSANLMTTALVHCVRTGAATSQPACAGQPRRASLVDLASATTPGSTATTRPPN